MLLIFTHGNGLEDARAHAHTHTHTHTHARTHARTNARTRTHTRTHTPGSPAAKLLRAGAGGLHLG